MDQVIEAVQIEVVDILRQRFHQRFSRYDFVQIFEQARHEFPLGFRQENGGPLGINELPAFGVEVPSTREPICGDGALRHPTGHAMQRGNQHLDKRQHLP